VDLFLSLVEALALMGAACEFGLRIARCKSLRKVELLVLWTHKNETVTVAIRHPYGFWNAVIVTDCARGLARSENNSPVTASDVVFRLRKAMLDKGKMP
jgi:hypothetical protein